MWWEIKDHLSIVDNKLYIANIQVSEIARRFGTPLFIYNANRVAEKFRFFFRALKRYIPQTVRIHYSMKANNNPKILEALRYEGSWLDCVSPEEVEYAIENGFSPERILFTGVSVSTEDLKKVLGLGVRVNVDSISQIKKISKIRKDIPISLRIDPGISGVGHSWRTITAGKEAHNVPIKFSIPLDQIKNAVNIAKEEDLKIVGIHMHVGSNWKTEEEVKEFLQASRILVKQAKEVENMISDKLEFINFGGGPGIRYSEKESDFPIETYSKGLSEILNEENYDVQNVAFEPGRYLVGDAGILVVKVVDIKERYGDIIVGVDSGFNHLIRPVLYGSYHEIINCDNVNGNDKKSVTIVGNLCETGDVFAVRRVIPMPKEDDILAIHNAGAYGYVMASRYNMRKLPKEVVIYKSRLTIYEDVYNKRIVMEEII
jgi:diaminopimelate decarboxylase